MSLFAKLDRVRWRWYEWQARRSVESAWHNPPPSVPLPAGPPIIVSLTSYPKRFGTLALTLKSLLRQTLRPEAVVLWIGERDMDMIPQEIHSLQPEGLHIRACQDFRSYTKFVHAIRDYPKHRIAICDDDTWYRPDWLETLAAPLPPDQIACQRIHSITLDANGHVRPYGQWMQESEARDVSPLNFPTGVGGVLFRPDQLHPDVHDMATAMSLCPSADDIWLYFMGRLAGSLFTRVGNNNPLISWRSSQESALWRINNGDSANDGQMDALMQRFGTEILDERQVSYAMQV